MKKLDGLGISPAPWNKVLDEFGDKESEYQVAVADARFPVGAVTLSWNYCEADARLIAAAPDLYDALQQIIQCWGASVFDEGGMACDTPLYCKHAGCRPETCPVFLRAKSALAKAAGEETK